MLRAGQIARGTLAFGVALNMSWNDLFSSLYRSVDLCLSKQCYRRSFHEMLRAGQIARGSLAFGEAPNGKGGPLHSESPLTWSWNDLFSSLYRSVDLCLSKQCNRRSFHEMLRGVTNWKGEPCIRRSPKWQGGTLAFGVALNMSWHDLFSSLYRSVDLCLSKQCNRRSFHEMLRAGQIARGEPCIRESPKWQGGTLAFGVALNMSWNDLFSSLYRSVDLCLSKQCNHRSFHEMLRAGQIARGGPLHSESPLTCHEMISFHLYIGV